MTWTATPPTSPGWYWVRHEKMPPTIALVSLQGISRGSSPVTDITAHPEFSAFTAAIEGAPGDDTPRLIFADWLEDHGEEQRAEFIRVQCELGKLQEPESITITIIPRPKTWEEERLTYCRRCRDLGSLCEYHKVQFREYESLYERSNWREWTGPAKAIIASGAYIEDHAKFHRGFLSRVRCSWEDWSRHGDAILADPWVPGLDEVELTTAPETPFRESLLQDDGSWKPLYEIRWPAVRSWKLPLVDMYRNIGTHEWPVWEGIPIEPGQALEMTPDYRVRPITPPADEE